MLNSTLISYSFYQHLSLHRSLSQPGKMKENRLKASAIALGLFFLLLLNTLDFGVSQTTASKRLSNFNLFWFFLQIIDVYFRRQLVINICPDFLKIADILDFPDFFQIIWLAFKNETGKKAAYSQHHHYTRTLPIRLCNESSFKPV